MIRQTCQNNIKRVLNAKEAQAYLGIPRYSFEKAVQNGDIEYKLIGRKKFYPVWCLDKWQNDTTNHIDCSKEATSTMPISRILTKTEPEYSLERLLEQRMKQKQSNIASRELLNCKRKLVNKPMVNCPA